MGWLNQPRAWGLSWSWLQDGERSPDAARPSLSHYFALFKFSPLIIHKGDHPLSELFPLFLQGQKEWPVALYGGDFYDVVRAVWRPPVLLSLVTGATVAWRKTRPVWQKSVTALKFRKIWQVLKKTVKHVLCPFFLNKNLNGFVPFVWVWVKGVQQLG